ncbi:MAG: hypothetical protein KA387_01350 [Rubrivivax sp.]|jgi:hypothetical protein|nr:hypothetical protein [Rubrivivax sp.]
MRTIFCLSFLAVGGCASLTSQPLTEPKEGDAAKVEEGLVYHLPRNDVLVTVVTGDARAVESITIAPGPSYADTHSSFVLMFERNLIGDSVIDIGVTADGLLTKSDASRTPKLVEALAVVVEKSKFTMQSLPLGSETSCRIKGSHQFLLPIPSGAEEKDPKKKPEFNFTLDRRYSTTICGNDIEVSVEELVPATAAALAVQPVGEARPGVYYRQSRPFKVVVKPTGDFGLNAQQVILSPSRSPLRFLPYERTVLAKGAVTLGFVNGQPQAFNQTVDGEVPALLTLPAAVLQAYFAAVGAVFNGFSARDKAEAGAAVSEIQLEMAKHKLAACMAAIRKDPEDSQWLQSLGCTDAK